MSEIQPPPKLNRPCKNAEVGQTIRLVSDSMERLSEWMYETAQYIERKADAVKKD